MVTIISSLLKRKRHEFCNKVTMITLINVNLNGNFTMSPSSIYKMFITNCYNAPEIALHVKIS